MKQPVTLKQKEREEWRVYRDFLKTKLQEIKDRRDTLIYSENISKAGGFSAAVKRAWEAWV
jgi:hypothetical protein